MFGLNNENIDVIPNNEEKYISYTVHVNGGDRTEIFRLTKIHVKQPRRSRYKSKSVPIYTYVKVLFWREA